jgi:hypothetical protein
MKTYYNGPKGMRYGGMSRKPMMYGGSAGMGKKKKMMGGGMAKNSPEMSSAAPMTAAANMVMPQKLS